MLYVLLFWLTCAGFSSYIASQKNRNPVHWFLLGVVFGLFVLITIAVIPSLLNDTKVSSGSNSRIAGLNTWTCS